MQADIDRGVCETRDCEQPYAYKIVWVGATPAYACKEHAFRRNRDSSPDIQPVQNPHLANA